MDRLIRFGNDVVNGWLDAGAFTLAAALAYYAIFSIAPLLLISIHLASLFLDRNAAVEGLTKELIGLIGPAGSDGRCWTLPVQYSRKAGQGSSALPSCCSRRRFCRLASRCA